MALGFRTGAALARTENFAETGEDDGHRFPELDCVRHLLPANKLAAAERRAARLGVGADRALIAAGVLSEEVYLRALAASLGVAFEPLDDIPRAHCPIDNDRLIESGAAGLLPLSVDDDLFLVVTPRGKAARQILTLIAGNPARARRFRLTTAERLNRFVLRCAGRQLVSRASDHLRHKWPELSAAPPRRHGHMLTLAILAGLPLTCAILAPAATMLAFNVMLATVFLAWLGLRLAGVFTKSAPQAPSQQLTDAGLPVYTVISALYRESASVNGLMSAIERLDYPGIMAQTPQRRRMGL